MKDYTISELRKITEAYESMTTDTQSQVNTTDFPIRKGSQITYPSHYTDADKEHYEADMVRTFGKDWREDAESGKLSDPEIIADAPQSRRITNPEEFKEFDKVQRMNPDEYWKYQQAQKDNKETALPVRKSYNNSFYPNGKPRFVVGVVHDENGKAIGNTYYPASEDGKVQYPENEKKYHSGGKFLGLF